MADLLITAAEALLGTCDGARTRDAHGYNSFDGGFVRQLAAWGFERLTPKQRQALHKTLGKYRAQLQRHGIDYAAIPRPEIPTDSQGRREGNTPKPATPVTSPERTAILDGDMVTLAFRYNANVKDALKTVPGARWNPEKKVWTVKITSANANALHGFLTANGFILGAGLDSKLREVKELGEVLRTESAAADSSYRLQGLGKEPFPFQHAGISYALKAKRTFIGDEMGLGKTIQALGVIHAEQLYPALIICPATLKYNWEAEATACLPGKKIYRVEKRDDGDRKHTCNTQMTLFDGHTDCKQCAFETADVYVINYDILSSGWQQTHKKQVKLTPVVERIVKRGLKVVAADESHYMKNTDAQRTIAGCQIVEGVNVRLALTGTAIDNRVKELIGQLRWLDRLDEFGGQWKFLQRYCGATQKHIGRGRTAWDFSGASNLEELHEKLRATCYIRREKKQVMQELPDLLRSVVPVELDNAAEYRRAERELIGWIKDKVREDAAFLEKLEGLDDLDQELAIRAEQDNRANKARAAQVLVRFSALRQLAGKGKLKAAENWINDFLESDEKLIVFSYFKETQQALLKLYPNAAHVLGDDSAEERNRNVQRFQNDPNCKVIICSLMAASTGLTLTASSNVLFVEFGWTPSIHDQAEARAHRIGQKDNVTAHYLPAINTIDTDMLEIIDHKRKITNAVLKGEKTDDNAGLVQELVQKIMRRAE